MTEQFVRCPGCNRWTESGFRDNLCAFCSKPNGNQRFLAALREMVSTLPADELRRLAIEAGMQPGVFAPPSPQSPTGTVADLAREWSEDPGECPDKGRDEQISWTTMTAVRKACAAELERRLQAEQTAAEAKESAALASLADELHRIEAEETSAQRHAATIADPLERLAYLVGEVARQGGGELAVVAVAAVDAVRSQQPSGLHDALLNLHSACLALPDSLAHEREELLAVYQARERVMGVLESGEVVPQPTVPAEVDLANVASRLRATIGHIRDYWAEAVATDKGDVDMAVAMTRATAAIGDLERLAQQPTVPAEAVRAVAERMQTVLQCRQPVELAQEPWGWAASVMRQLAALLPSGERSDKDDG